MQTTLLGLAFAVILALVAALVGPHFVDWTSYRATFEREASRLVGMPVRINGAIDVTLLPTPTLTFGNVEAGDTAAPTVSARELHAELALGSLVRGEFRASDMRVVAPDVRLGLGADGRIDWPAARIGFDPDQLLLERVAIEGGRLALKDAASGATTTLEGLWFNGDLRSLLGPVKGEGGFAANGDRYSYRVSAGRVGEDGATKLRVSLDPADHPLNFVADGALRLDGAAPRFEGTLTVSRAVAVAGANGRGTITVPWRLTSRLKATAQQALFDGLEYQYGPDERALKLTGTAELRFGKNPRLDGVLSARQADLDRAFDLPDAVRRLPFAALKQVIESFGVAYRPSFPVHLGIGVDALTLAGGTLQGVRGDLNMEADGWDIETLEFRAPGFAQVRLSGRVALEAGRVSFKGPAKIDANDPKVLFAWLEGRAPEPGQAQLGALRASGDLSIGAQEIGASRLRVEFDRKVIEGRLAYAQAAAGRAARLEAELKAGELDIDGLVAFARAALEGSAFERPGEVALTADVGRATVAGVEVNGIKGKLTLDPAGLAFDNLQIADLAGASFNLNGRMNGPMSAPQGNVAFDVDARNLDGTIAVLTKFLPQAAEPLRGAAGKLTPLKARVTLNLEKAASGSTAKLGVDGTAGALRIRLSTEATGDIAAFTLPDVKLDGQIAAADGTALVSLIGLDRAVAVDKRPGTLTITARGAAGNDLKVDVRLAAGGLNATANGTARLFAANGAAASLDLVLQGDAAPLRRGTSLPVKLQARLTGNADEFTIDNLTGAVAGSAVRGKLKVMRGVTTRVDGRIDAEAVDAAALIAVAIGAPGSPARADAIWPAEPFGEGLFGDYEGRVEFTLARAALTPALIGRQVRGALRLGASEIALDDLEGVLAGGRASGQLTLKRVDAGLSASMRLALVGTDATSLLPGEARSGLSGRLGMQLTLEGAGMSPAALLGALDGSGTITLEDAAFAWLDPKAFGAAVKMADQSTALDAAKVRDVVTTVLDGGALAVPRLDAVLTISAGQARIGRIMVPAQGADLTLTGSADLVDATLDARLTLTGPSFGDGTTTTRPDILVLVKGPIAAPKRTIDVSAFSGWLMLRTVERQSKRLEAIEAERREAVAREAEHPTPTPAPPVSVALPAPADDATPVPAAPPVNAVPAQPRPKVERPAPTLRVQPPPERAPALPPPLEISPTPGNGRPRAAKQAPQPPPAPRSTFESLFGPLR